MCDLICVPLGAIGGGINISPTEWCRQLGVLSMAADVLWKTPSIYNFSHASHRNVQHCF